MYVYVRNNDRGGQSHYDYWNQFVTSWLSGAFISPDGLLNSCELPDKSTDLSERYVPEPWWGHNGNSEKPLYSVCINLNPGKGEAPLQTRDNQDVAGITAYSDLFRILKETNRWHNDKRALPIRKAISGLSGVQPLSNESDAIDNHLSIELIPWHTQHASSKLGYWDYVRNNFKDIYDYSFLFATEESRRATGPLHDTVILRFSGNTALKLLTLFMDNNLISGFSVCSLGPFDNYPDLHAWCFSVSSIPCRYLAIWRSKGHNLNDLPPSEELQAVFSRYGSIYP